MSSKGNAEYAAINGSAAEEGAPLLSKHTNGTSEVDGILVDHPDVRPTLRHSKAVYTVLVDATLMLALFFSAGTYLDNIRGYLVRTVSEYDYYTSTFDVFMVSVARCLILTPMFMNVIRLRPGATRLLVGLVPFVSFVFATVKLILMSTQEDTNNIVAGKAWAFSILVISILFTLAETYFVYTVPKLLQEATEKSAKARADMAKAKIAAEKDKENGKKVEKDEKPKKSQVGLKRLLSLAIPEWRILSVAMVALVLNSLTQLVLPYVFGVVVDALDGADSDEALAELNLAVIKLIVIFALGSAFAFVRAWLFTLAGQRVVARLRKDVFRSVINQEIAFFDKTRTGELTSRLSSDTQVIQNAVTTNVSMLVRYAIQIVGSIIVLFILSWQLTLIMVAVVPLVAVGAVIYGRYLQKLQKTFQDELAGATTVAEEVISNLRTVRSFSKERRSADNYGDAVHKSYTVGRQIAMAYGLFQGVIGFVPQAAIGLILWYGGTLVINEVLSVGFLTSFLLYTLSVAMAFAFLSSLFGDFMAAVGASERIFELVDRKPEIPTFGGKRLQNFSGKVEFDNVTFTYPTRPDQSVLKDISLSLEPGKVLALVGPSGGGKSTIVSLMERFYDVTKGAVRVDDVDVRELDPEWYRSCVALVSQEPVLFATTIRENICFALDREVSDEEIQAAAKAANAHDFIVNFTDGYKTEVGERGVRLSGGQKQRIAICRALLMNPRILLLDEATSALDAESEYLVQDAIDKAMKNRTVLIIAHRLSTVRNADVIAVLSDGGIVELGSHDELLQKDGLYKKLVSRQLQGNDLNTAFSELQEETVKATGSMPNSRKPTDDGTVAAQ